MICMTFSGLDKIGKEQRCFR